MKKSIYILCILLFSFSDLYGQRGNERSWKKQALNDATLLSSEDYPYIDLFHKAIKEQIAGNYKEAKKLFLDCLKENEYDDAVHFALAEIYLKEKDVHKALLHFQKANAIDPNNITYLEKLAYTYFELDNYKEAQKQFKALCEEQPRNVDFRYGYTRVLIFNKAYEDAAEQLKKIQEQVGIVPELSIMQADLYTEVNQDEKAEETLLNLKSLYPHNLEVLKKLIGFYESRDERDKAVQMIEELVHNDPENGQALYILANNYLAVEKPNDFIQIAPKVLHNKNVDFEDKVFVYERLNEMKPSQDTLTFNLSKLLYESHPDKTKARLFYARKLLKQYQPQKAIQILRENLEETDANFDFYNHLLNFESLCKDYNALYKDAQKAISLYPTSPIFYYHAAEGALQMEEYNSASTLLSNGEMYVLDNDMQSARFYMRKGEIYFQQKEFKKGIVAFENALNLHEDDMILVTYANALSLAKIALPEAKALLEKVSKKEENYYVAFAHYSIATQKYNQGIKTIKKSLTDHYINMYPVVYDVLGDLYFFNQQPQKAVELWKKALENGHTNKVLQQKINEIKYYKAVYK